MKKGGSPGKLRKKGNGRRQKKKKVEWGGLARQYEGIASGKRQEFVPRCHQPLKHTQLLPRWLGLPSASPKHREASAQRSLQKLRSCILSSAGLSHCRESQSLTRKRMLTSEKEMYSLAQSQQAEQTGQLRAPTGSF